MTTSRSLSRAILALLLVAGGLVAAPAAPPAAAQDSGGDTSAVAVNTKDGSTLFRFAFSIKQIMGEVVDQQNAAVAYANCEECTTVAISVQVLLVSGSPDEVTPTNLAVALNEDCTECQTLAAAYQFVFGNGEELRFTAEGRQRIADIRRRFRQLRTSGLSVEEIQAEADALAGELRDVLRSEVTTRGQNGSAEESQAADGPQSSTTTTPGEDPSSSPPSSTHTTPAETTPPPTQTMPPPAETTPTPTQTAPEPEPQADDSPSTSDPTATQP
jgi:putative peptide zinc metalloprotease protein